MLTRDPSWGRGEAAIYGSDAIAGGWQQGDAESAPGFPEPEKVWFIDIGTDYRPDLALDGRQGRHHPHPDRA